MSKAFLFPGQGSQRIHMGEDLYNQSEKARAVFELAATVVPDLLAVCFGEDQAALNQTEYAQPAIVTVSAALWECIPQQARSGYVTGHSLGEYSALYAAGVLGLAEALELVNFRGAIMAKAARKVPGGMIAVMGVDFPTISGLIAELNLQDELYPANRNSPQQTVLSGLDEAIGEFSEIALARGAKVVRLGVSGPFHSLLMNDAAREFAEVLRDFTFAEPQVPFVSATTAGKLETATQIKEALISQLTGPVLWTDTIAWLGQVGVDTMIEVGPGNVLTGLVKRIDPALHRINVSRLEQIEGLV